MMPAGSQSPQWIRSARLTVSFVTPIEAPDPLSLVGRMSAKAGQPRPVNQGWSTKAGQPIGSVRAPASWQACRRSFPHRRHLTLRAMARKYAPPSSNPERLGMSRFLSLAEAVELTVRDGDAVAMEGFTHLIPHAAAHEVIRQRRKRLTLIRMTPDLVYDQLVGMGCAEKMIFSWTGNPGVGSLHRVRDAIENGWPQPLAYEEHSHSAMANAYEAGAAGLPCAIFLGYIGVD